jgi:hypothetical protein
MERNQRDRASQSEQKREKASKNVEQDRARRASETQRQGGGQSGGQGGFDRDIPRRGSEENYDIDRQAGTPIPGRRSEQGVGQTASPRQPGLGETGRTGSGQRLP